MIRSPRILFPLMLLLVVVSAGAQERLLDDMAEFYTYGDNYFIEVATMPGIVSAKGRVLVTFRFSYDLLTFQKTSRAYERNSVYVAMPSLYVEVVGSDGVIVDRGSWRDTARVQDYARTNSKSDFISGSIEMAARPGLYTIKYSFDDGSPGSGFSRNTQPFAMDDFASRSPALGTPVFLRSAVSDTLTLASIDGAASFGRRLRAFVPIGGPTPPSEIRYEIAEVPKKGEPMKVLRTGSGTLLGPAAVQTVLANGNDVRLVLNRSLPDTARSYGALIDCPSDEFNVGDYILTLTATAGQNSVTDSSRFKIRWVEMPFSLSKPDYAIRALYPIATDETIDELLSGGRDKQRRAISAYWEKRDPTPDTRYNEAMAEYYRRVDYAFFNFKSIGQTDGTYTDRGKIYILYGPPGEVTRDMQPNTAPREVWVYHNAVHRRFFFVGESPSGENSLVE